MTTPSFRVKLSDADVGEEELAAIARVLSSGVLTKGSQTRRFEEVFARRHEVDHAVAFANGTIALTAIYLALGIGPGDEVIVPSLTFISSATSILHAGATPVFAEVDPDTFTLDPSDVATRLTDRTKAVLVVHYGGQPADLAHLRAITDEAGIQLLEDAAQAHGATYLGRPVGGFGTAGMFSFTPTKNITTGEGGMVTTNNGGLADRLRLLRDHGQTSLYEHAVLGYNWRMTELQAAMGVVQVGKLDGILARKRTNAKWMGERLSSLKGVQAPVERPDREHVFMLYTLLFDQELDRDAVCDDLMAAGCETRVYFPPAHRQPIFAAMEVRLPVTEHIARRMLSIPFNSKLTIGELEHLADSLENAVSKQQ